MFMYIYIYIKQLHGVRQCCGFEIFGSPRSGSGSLVRPQTDPCKSTFLQNTVSAKYIFYLNFFSVTRFCLL